MGLGPRYTYNDDPPRLDEYLDALIGAAREHLPAGARILIEPGRSVVATNAVTVCTVTTIKPGATTFVAVDGGMADNLEVALVGQRFEATIANRVGGGAPVTVVGRHYESGDVLSDPVPLDARGWVTCSRYPPPARTATRRRTTTTAPAGSR
ncbi:MAG TPA: hypothetical protein VGJ95_09115 [Pseudonocardiaceae bacterium]